MHKYSVACCSCESIDKYAFQLEPLYGLYGMLNGRQKSFTHTGYTGFGVRNFIALWANAGNFFRSFLCRTTVYQNSDLNMR